MDIEKAEHFSIPINVCLNHLVVGVCEIPGFYIGNRVSGENGDIQVLVFPAVGHCIGQCRKAFLDAVIPD